MKYIRPKTLKKKVNWNISEKTLTILSYYSKYSQYSEEEIVDMFTENLLLIKVLLNGLISCDIRKRLKKYLKSAH